MKVNALAVRELRVFGCYGLHALQCTTDSYILPNKFKLFFLNDTFANHTLKLSSTETFSAHNFGCGGGHMHSQSREMVCK